MRDARNYRRTNERQGPGKSRGQKRTPALLVAGFLAFLLPAFPPSNLATVPSSRLHYQEGIPIGSKAPVISVNDLDGRPVDLGTVIGKKAMLLEFWATWCPKCESLLPKVKAAAAKYGSRVEFLGVNVTVNQTPARVRRYLAEHKPPFRTLYDEKGVAVRAYQAAETSFIVIVDPSGRVAYTGSGEDQDLDGALKKALGGSGR